MSYESDFSIPLMPHMKVTITLEVDEDGAICFACEQLGAFTSGKTIREALVNGAEAIDVSLWHLDADKEERAFLQAHIAQCKAFIEELPATRVIERLGFEHQLQEFQSRLDALDAKEPK